MTDLSGTYMLLTLQPGQSPEDVCPDGWRVISVRPLSAWGWGSLLIQQDKRMEEDEHGNKSSS